MGNQTKWNEWNLGHEMIPEQVPFAEEGHEIQCVLWVELKFVTCNLCLVQSMIVQVNMGMHVCMLKFNRHRLWCAATCLICFSVFSCCFEEELWQHKFNFHVLFTSSGCLIEVIIYYFYISWILLMGKSSELKCPHAVKGHNLAFI